MSEFDEYQAEAVLRECLPQLLQVNAEIKELHRAHEGSSESRWTGARRFRSCLRRSLAGGWREKSLADGVEPWHEFCLRVERGLAQVVRDTPPAASAVVFTSAGPIGAAMRRALHLSAEDTLRMTWMSRNASFTDFLASGERFTLSTFNAHPHLDGDGLLTYR